MSPGKGFLVCEANDEGIQNYVRDWSPLVTAKFVPIVQWRQLRDEIERYKALSDAVYT